MSWPAVFDLARRRHGVVCCADAERAGLSRRALERRAHVDGWTSLHPCVWMVAGREVTDLARVAAAVLSTERGVASHRSALWLHGVIDRPPRRPEILVPYGARGPVAGQRIRVHRSRRLPKDHVMRCQNVPTTVVERSILDVSATYSSGRLRNLVVDGQRNAGLCLKTLADLRDEFGVGRRGMGTLDRVLMDPVLGLVDSGWEAEVRDQLVTLGLQVHPGPFPYLCPDGVTVHLDLAIPSAWVCVELDGRAYHSDPATFASDRIRWTQIARAWTIVWVTHDRWSNDRAGVIRDILEAVQAADPARPSARPA